ncbi:hypothetical protein SAMN05421770_101378 [Granulicella rosea]|uniref:Uncharacterized protein n=1 Tax=Granulicella rosea TaxID=474952 RepID=A0A239DB41_9BACT|nr:hypothetical protein [Granulicella rosea]SNS29497.1 hypothetical protein SAMN05421770_101378 [Granulicella rosea]
MLSSSFRGRILLLAVFVAFSVLPRARAQTPPEVKTLLAKLVENESAAYMRKPPYAYISIERSDRTGGHLWKERVAETSFGKVKFLVEEDGQPLSPERAAAERARVAEIAAHPDAFKKREQAMRNDESHARDMLVLLPKAFLFDPPKPEGEYVRIAFRPNPDYVAQSMEERVLHGMSGSVLIEPKEVRLRAIEGRMPADVSIGYGLIATIKAGSNFSTTREHIEAAEWKTQRIDTAIVGRAIFFKTIAKKEESIHSDFHRVPTDITVAQAVEMLEK